MVQTTAPVGIQREEASEEELKRFAEAGKKTRLARQINLRTLLRLRIAT
jgi:hypothetical protein